MEATVSLRAFAVDDPETVETWGVIADHDSVAGEWEFHHDPLPDAFGGAFERYVDEELKELSGTPPLPQAVYDGIVVVLDHLLFDVLEDGVEYRYRVEVPGNQAINSERTDGETGLVAERTVSDDRIADGMQRSADGLDHTVEWLDVISPRSFAGIAEAADGLIDDEEAGRE